ncbi:MAG: rhomboid family intramembrane serine protease [Phycisphaerae bacterium]|nr:rhomboid family intramembrane serine protease [Phycisphaerae bacterium]
MNRTHQVHWQRPAPSQLFTPAVTTILALSTLGFICTLFLTDFTGNWLALNPQRVLRGPLWQLVTYPFVCACPWTFIFTMMTILFLGSAVEREWRTKSFVALWCVVSIVCGLLWTVVSLLMGQPFMGTSAAACSYGIIAVFGLLFRGTPMLMLVATVEAQVMAMILIGLGVILSLAAPITLIWVFGAAVGYAYVKWLWHRNTSHAKVSGSHASGSSYKPGSFVDVD